MVILDTDFSDGDFLTAGIVTSTSGVNGMTFQINTNNVAKPPIGSIVAWAKTLTSVPALPSGWLECNGQTISDANSPMNGEAVPDLTTANRFLRGNATSGGTGGQATSGSASKDEGGLTAFSFQPGNEDNQPPYYNVVWIIRVS